MFLQDGLVVKSGRILVPNNLKYQVTRDFHDADHWGAENTYKEISKKYYWPNMKRYIDEYVASCDTCTKTKHSNSKPKAYLKPHNWAEYFPRQAIALDLATMVRSRDGYKYIMLITDGMSKFAELCPLRDITASSVTNQIKREWIARHGPPETLLTDQGQQVDGAEVRQLCEKYNIHKKRSSPYHPEGDGISERQIGTMKGLFRTKLASDNLPANRWPELLPDVQLAMNNKRHAATKHTPTELMFGETTRPIRSDDTTMSSNRKPPECSANSLNEETSLQKQFKIRRAQEHLQEAANNMKKHYDQSAHEYTVSVGDQVYVKKNAVRRGESRKLSPLFHNLSEVVEVEMPLIRIKNLSSGQIQWRHHNQLKKRIPISQTTSNSKNSRVRFNDKPHTTATQNIDNTDFLGDEASLEETHIDYDYDYDAPPPDPSPDNINEINQNIGSIPTATNVESNPSPEPNANNDLQSWLRGDESNVDTNTGGGRMNNVNNEQDQIDEPLIIADNGATNSSTTRRYPSRIRRGTQQEGDHYY